MRRNRLDRYYLLVLFIAFVVLLLGLGTYGFAETSEARYAEIGREMLRLGDYLNPQLLGVFHFDKPPMTYYITTLGYRIFGVNEFGARFFLQVAIILQMVFIYGITKLLYKDRKLAFIAGLIYFSLPIVLISCRNLTTDAYLTTSIIGALYCWQYYTSKKVVGYLYGFYTIMALSLLIKGPVSLLFILTYIITYKVIHKEKFKLTIHHILGFIACLLIASSWFILVIIENPRLWDYFINKQLVSRMTKNSFNRGKPFWYFIPIIVGILFPWGMGLFEGSKIKRKSFKTLSNPTRVLLISSAVLLILFSVFKTKLMLYILPTFWMIAILLAKAILKMGPAARNRITYCFVVLMALLFVGIIGLKFIDIPFISVTTKAIFFTVIVFLCFGLVFFMVDKENLMKPAITAFSFGAGLVLIATTVMASNSDLINSDKKIISFVNAISPKKKTTVLVYNYLLSGIPLYTNAKEITLQGNYYTTQRNVQFQKNEQWKQNLWNIHQPEVVSDLDSLSNKAHTFLLIRKKTKLKKNLKFLRNNFKHKKEFLKWELLYNK